MPHVAVCHCCGAESTRLRGGFDAATLVHGDLPRGTRTGAETITFVYDARGRVVQVPHFEEPPRQRAHRRYARFINARHRWTGHLWQGRFGAVVMDEEHLVHAARYVAMNPVRARLCDRAEDWPWSSARAHLAGCNDDLVEVAPLLDRVGDFAAFMGSDEDQQATRALRKAETTGRPLGNASWVARLEQQTGRALAARKRGRKRHEIRLLSP